MCQKSSKGGRDNEQEGIPMGCRSAGQQCIATANEGLAHELHDTSMVTEVHCVKGVNIPGPSWSACYMNMHQMALVQQGINTKHMLLLFCICCIIPEHQLDTLKKCFERSTLLTLL